MVGTSKSLDFFCRQPYTAGMKNESAAGRRQHDRILKRNSTSKFKFEILKLKFKFDRIFKIKKSRFWIKICRTAIKKRGEFNVSKFFIKFNFFFNLHESRFGHNGHTLLRFYYDNQRCRTCAPDHLETEDQNLTPVLHNSHKTQRYVLLRNGPPCTLWKPQT